MLARDAIFLEIQAVHEEQLADLLPFMFGEVEMEGVPFRMLEAWDLEHLLRNLRPC
jgi:hypothetical protein